MYPYFNLRHKGIIMKKILVGVDTSGSVEIEKARRFTAKFISTLCPDSQIDLALFNYNNSDVVNMKDFFDGKLLGDGGASGTHRVRETAIDGDYDHLYIITDGYMDTNDLLHSDTVSVVIYE